MEAITVERVREKRTVAVSAVVAYVGAAAFIVAGVWATLVSRGITAPSEPAVNPKLSVHQNQMLYLRWLIAKQPQERISTAIGIVAFFCLLATVVALRDRLGRPASSLAIQAVAIGVVLWVSEQVLHVGAQYALGMLTTHGYSMDTVTGIDFTVDMIARALEVTAFVMLGVGAFALALGAWRGTLRSSGWAAWTAAIGVAMIVASWATLAGAGTLGDILVALVAVILLPGWMWWSVRLLPALGTGAQ